MGSFDVLSLEILVTTAKQKDADRSIIKVAAVPKIVRLIEIPNHRATTHFPLVDDSALAFITVLHQQSLHVDVLKVVVTV